MIERIIRRLRGGYTLQEEMTSVKLREEHAAQGRKIGLYSYGCFDMSRISRGTTIGRYCSFSPTARVQTRNHGLGFIGLSAYFYEPALDVAAGDPIQVSPVTIGDDVWLGANAVVVASAGSIGRGAAIGANAVVTKPVPPYAIVVGSPARVLRYRFDQATIDDIEATRWWELDPDGLRALVKNQPELVYDPVKHFARSEA